MSAQELFNAAYLGVLKQGRPSYIKDLGCMYRGTDDLKCAIGHILTDDEYNPSLEHKPVHRLRLPERLTPYSTLLHNLQRAHDAAADLSPDHFLERFKQNMKLVAETHNLEIPHDAAATI